MTILFTFGIADTGVAIVLPDAQGQMKLFVDGSCNVIGKINLGAVKPIPLLLYGPNAVQPPLNLPVKPSLVFNQISDADSHATALKRCITACEHLPDVPVINHPQQILGTGRDRVAEGLQGIEGVIMPRTVRCAPTQPEEVFQTAELENLGWPLIMRLAGVHNAKGTVLIDNPSDAGKLSRFALDGRDYYLTEFVDCRNEQGVYSKARLVCVDGQFFVRHINFGDQWIVNSSSRSFMKTHPELGDPLAMAQELEDNFMSKAKPSLQRIAQRLELDYFGIDCHINETGEFVIFEANANMNILIGNEEGIFGERRDRVVAALRELIQKRSGESLP